MIIDREYPATHSMSTSWYVVDDDGNLGIVDYNENGPVPVGVEETSLESLVWGHEEDYHTNDFLSFNLNDSQIFEIIGKPHDPLENGVYDSVNVVVRINLSLDNRWSEISRYHYHDCNDAYIDIEVCISKERGLFLIDTLYFTDSGGRLIKDSLLYNAVKEGVITEVYPMWDFDWDDNVEDGKVVFSHNPFHCPYYVFCQPYWTDFLPKKLISPVYPVNISQVPEKFRSRIHRIPGKFSEMDTFQVALYYETDVYTDAVVVLDTRNSYCLLPLEDGSEAYLLSGRYNFSVYDFHPLYLTKDATPKYFFNIKVCATLPTVLFLASPTQEFNFIAKVKTDIVYQNSIWVKLLPEIDVDGFYRSIDVHASTPEQHSTFISFARSYVEKVVSKINPRLIVIEDEAWEFFRELFETEDYNCMISGKNYNFCMRSDIEANRGWAEALAKMSYRGEMVKMRIEKKEMERLLEEGRAVYYRDFL